MTRQKKRCFRTPSSSEWWRRTGRVSVEEAQRGYLYFYITPPPTAVDDIDDNVRVPYVALATTIRKAVAVVEGGSSQATHANWCDYDGWHIFGIPCGSKELIKISRSARHIRRYDPSANKPNETLTKNSIVSKYIGRIVCGFDPRNRNASISDWIEIPHDPNLTD